MNNVEFTTILVKAQVSVHTNEFLGWRTFEGLKEGSQQSVLIDGIAYTTVVHQCPQIIRPGTTGELDLLFVSEAVLESSISVGGEYAFGRARQEVGHLVVKSMCQVNITRVKHPERKYMVEPVTEL